MSLINDALKKAARQRAEEQADVVAPMPGGGNRHAPGSGGPMRTQTMVLIGAAAVALIVVSAVVTGVFVAGKSEQKSAAMAPVPTPTPSPQKVVVQSPVIALPQVLQTSAPSPTPVAATKPASAPVLHPLPAARQVPSPVISAPAAAASVASAPESHNDLIQGIIDRYRISGVRAAGLDSKALVDGHVYKVNDLIDKSLGLKLVKVESDHLTFVDAQGETYVRSF
jgi:hypothetical protein